MHRLLAVAGALLLSACAGTNTGWSDQNAERGTVIVAFAADKTAGSFRAFDLDIRRTDGSPAADISYTLRGMDADRPDFQTDSEQGIVAQKLLPPGEYEIVDAVGDQGTFWWAKETRPSQPIALRFVVAPGSVTYIGHVRVGLSEASAQPALAVAISNEDRTDIARAMRKYPGLGPITVAGLDTGSSGEAVH